MSTETGHKQTRPEKLTPMMRQYLTIKRNNPSTLLLYRMGDFYEMFNEDARIAAQVLGLTLTSRNHGGDESTPLAGFPYHALDRYANRLVKAGHKIAICEQTEDPKKAKGVVKRDVVEVITAGTATENNFIDERSNNFIVGIAQNGNRAGVAICDLSTGDFTVDEADCREIQEELVRVDPSEAVVADTEGSEAAELAGRIGEHVLVSKYDPWKFDRHHAEQVLCSHFDVVSLEGMGLESYREGVQAAGGLLSYLKEQKRSDLRHISAIVPRSMSEYAEVDPATIRNLELLKPLHGEDTQGTLLSVLDKTSTALGARLMKRWITHPLKNIERINRRLDCVQWLKRDVFARGETELLLKGIADLERLMGRVMCERANARDLIALRNSLRVFPRLTKALSSSTEERIKELVLDLEGFEECERRIGSVLAENPPLSIREGGLINPGVSPELDTIREAATNGKKWIAGLQEKERSRTGIASLKVGYNKVFGYYLEVSKSNLSSVPSEYLRKQTLVNGERYITPELKEMEEKLLGAEERQASLEYDLFVQLRAEIALQCVRVQRAGAAVAELDVLVCLARVAADGRFCRPALHEDTRMVVRDGRHPVIENMGIEEEFVPNDVVLDRSESQILLITGPNMAGKSTYLRQNALIAIMAQIGSFVPATAAEIGVVDKFFTRVGASDRLARGQSTFLVEMIEVANILNNAGDRSLVLLDEVGRGTSTFDGISIAWAVAEYLHETPNRRPRTLFATHYHELTELALLFPRIRNVHVKVKEWNDKIIFLRKIDEGSCDHSYGIQVARLAGVPRPVILRAKEILANLESMELTPDRTPVLARHKEDTRSAPDIQTDLFSSAPGASREDLRARDVAAELRQIEPNNLTPLEALSLLSELSAKLRE